jgi:hypothetical protein
MKVTWNLPLTPGFHRISSVKESYPVSMKKVSDLEIDAHGGSAARLAERRASRKAVDGRKVKTGHGQGTRKEEKKKAKET